MNGTDSHLAGPWAVRTTFTHRRPTLPRHDRNTPTMTRAARNRRAAIQAQSKAQWYERRDRGRAKARRLAGNTPTPVDEVTASPTGWKCLSCRVSTEPGMKRCRPCHLEYLKALDQGRCVDPSVLKDGPGGALDPESGKNLRERTGGPL